MYISMFFHCFIKGIQGVGAAMIAFATLNSAKLLFMNFFGIHPTENNLELFLFIEHDVFTLLSTVIGALAVIQIPRDPEDYLENRLYYPGYFVLSYVVVNHAILFIISFFDVVKTLEMITPLFIFELIKYSLLFVVVLNANKWNRLFVSQSSSAN